MGHIQEQTGKGGARPKQDWTRLWDKTHPPQDRTSAQGLTLTASLHSGHNPLSCKQKGLFLTPQEVATSRTNLHGGQALGLGLLSQYNTRTCRETKDCSFHFAALGRTINSDSSSGLTLRLLTTEVGPKGREKVRDHGRTAALLAMCGLCTGGYSVVRHRTRTAPNPADY